MPREGEIYRHYKGNVYRVVALAKHSETLEELVVYEEVGKPGKVWARPAHMWDEIVSVDGKSVRRFELIRDRNE